MQTGALLLESFDIAQQEEAAKTKQFQLDEETGTPSKEEPWTKARRLGFEVPEREKQEVLAAIVARKDEVINPRP